MNASPELNDVIQWLSSQLSRGLGFATVSVNITVHDHRISLIERTVSEKTKPTENGGTRYERGK